MFEPEVVFYLFKNIEWMSKKLFLVTELVEVTFENHAIVTSTSSGTVLFGHPGAIQLIISN